MSDSKPLAACKPPSADLAHYLAIPWCAAHLTASPAVRVWEHSATGTAEPPGPRPPEPPALSSPFASRALTGENHQGDGLWARTLNTETTIPHCLVFYSQPPGEEGESLLVEGKDTGGVESEREKNVPITALAAFLTLREHVDGIPGVAHGGVVATILDEVTGLLPALNRRRRRGVGREHEQQEGAESRSWPPELGAYMTAYLNTTFVRPVRCPATVLEHEQLARVQGRKMYIEGTIEDEAGRVLAKGEALFVAMKPREGKL